MILTDDNFASIVNAIEEGRGIFDNIRKFVNYLLSSNFGEVLVIFLATLFGMPLPLTAVHILWVNLVTDGLPAVGLGMDPAEKGIMNRPPRPARENVISKQLLFQIIFSGTLIGLGTLGLFLFFLNEDLIRAQTVALTALVMFEIVRLYIIRSQYNIKMFSNLFLVGAVVLSLALQVLIIYSPLRWFFGTTPLALTEWLAIIGGAAALIGVARISRLFFRIRKGQSP
jgi:Ca2+-transporting ATPase